MLIFNIRAFLIIFVTVFVLRNGKISFLLLLLGIFKNYSGA